MYEREMRAQDTKDEDQDHTDDFSTNDGYNWLRTYSNTIKIYESHEQIIA